MLSLHQVAAFFLLLVLCASPGSAQEHTAALSGAVRGQNAGLPQVTVRLHSEKPNQVLATTVTANDGSFGFAGLPCGDSFTLAFSRTGWEPRRIRHLQLRSNSTVRVIVFLYSASEPSYRRAPPQITDQSPWWGTQFGPLQLDDLPNARNIWSLLQAQEPSTVTNRIDVGGMETGAPALFGAQGASWTENQAIQAVLPRGTLSGYLDVFNVLNANSNILESDLSGPAFLTRVPLTVEAPRTARLGVEWKF
ncbi:MAG TPA: carboxypeptidase-like regulatory domain-containing protein [Terriglobales bacterium]|nr:carboxypeptidase-like regulatory domain-containing protein [Terriglobales bacterium]